MVVQNFTLFQLNLSHDYDSKDILWEMLLQELSRIKTEKSLKWADVIKEVINSQILIDVITNSTSVSVPFTTQIHYSLMLLTLTINEIGIQVERVKDSSKSKT